MKEFYSFKKKKREEIIEKIKKTLLKDKNVIFAYIFGSFLGSASFRDIDVGIYLKNISSDNILNYESNLSKNIAKVCKIPFDLIDVKVLNFAPNSFLNSVFKFGKLLFSKDRELTSNLIEKTSLEAIINESISYQSLRELIH
jgi:predicted nucleotidyltransferase